MEKLIVVAMLCVSVATGAWTVSGTDGSVTAKAPASQAAFAPPARGDTRRYLLVNRLLGTSCLLARSGVKVELLGACKDTFAAAARIRRMRHDGSRITFVDAVGSAVIDFAWDAETGMSSIASPLHPETGALGLVPVAARG